MSNYQGMKSFSDYKRPTGPRNSYHRHSRYNLALKKRLEEEMQRKIERNKKRLALKIKDEKV